MSNKDIEKQHDQTFENIKQLGNDGFEYWMARQLGKTLDYAEYRNFLPVIEKAKKACVNSGQLLENHFVEMHEMVPIGSGAERKMESYALSRYACYLIVQNGDPSKSVIANGQTYFAIQTRRQELADDVAFQELKEDEKRFYLRNEMKEHNKKLVEAAQQAGVESNLDFAIFQNHGYKGLYGGLDAKRIHARKGLKKSQQILDNMGSTELAANLFRATQTEDKLRRENVTGKEKANKTHFEVGSKIRQTIKDLGGTMPENLPTPENDLKSIEKKVKTKLEITEKTENSIVPVNNNLHTGSVLPENSSPKIPTINDEKWNEIINKIKEIQNSLGFQLEEGHFIEDDYIDGVLNITLVFYPDFIFRQLKRKNKVINKLVSSIAGFPVNVHICEIIN
ncbi:DNA damage-inducible protein D [Myxococcota bacterium]|nr:DNA damage-inducible protein D [Myxococcota bacterium]MBU1379449.1 DNA damage-inducible protein D [Myxococcota bacterium]MBU1496152.1 DNA damage-inducible protein D [Myxococcota bacterium]